MDRSNGKKFKSKNKPFRNQVDKVKSSQSSNDKIVKTNGENKSDASKRIKKKFKNRKEDIRNKNRFKKKNENNQIWFDGVDECLIKASANNNDNKKEKLVKEKSFSGLTKAVAMDCEMVGVGDGDQSMLARVSIVNYFGHCVYDKYVKPMEDITDFRTHVSGIRPSNLVDAEHFRVVQKQVGDILKDRTLVGHALQNDLKVLYIGHPKHMIRDTSKFFRKLLGGRRPALKKLAESILGVRVQTGEHDSVQDAQVAMRLYTMYRKKWETMQHKRRRKFIKKQKSKSK